MAELANIPADEIAPAELVALCPHCLAANSPSAYFCRVCQTPMRTIAEIDPLGRIYAMVDTYRKAAQGPPSVLVVVAMGLICLSAMAGSAAALASVRGDIWTGDLRSLLDFRLLLALAYGVGGITVFGNLFYRTCRNYLKHRPAAGDAAEDDAPTDFTEPGDVSDDSSEPADDAENP